MSAVRGRKDEASAHPFLDVKEGIHIYSTGSGAVKLDGIIFPPHCLERGQHKRFTLKVFDLDEVSVADLEEYLVDYDRSVLQVLED
jgi:hypothetical protein